MYGENIMIQILSIIAVLSIMLSILMDNKGILLSAVVSILCMNVPFLHTFNWFSMLELILIVFTLISSTVVAYRKNKQKSFNK